MGKLFTNAPGSEGRNGRRLKATFLLGLMAFVLVSTTLLEPRPAKAQYTDPITSIQTTTTNVWTTIKDAFVEAAVTAVVNGVNYFTSQLAYTLAVALTSDCPGQVVCWNSKAFEDGFKQAWQGAIGEAVGTLSQQGGFAKLGFDLCNPSIKFALKIQLGALDEIKPPPPKCDFNALVNNWDSFKDSVSSGEVLKGLKPTFEKGQSGLSIALGAQSGLYEVKEEAKRADIMKRIMDASAGGGFSDVRDPVSGRAKAPSSVTHDEFQRMRKMQQDNPQQYSASYAAGQIASKAVISIVVNAVQTFAMTLVSRLLNKLINGLMSTEELIALQPDLILNPEGLLQPPGATGAAEALATRFSAAAPKDAGTIDPLLNFSVCPGANRGPDNCVIDQQFANAIRVADVTPVTVKEAIDKNMLHGDWPLIPDTDQVKDQDPFCYTYAYCESNIKKLRAARIIPVGWEIAAHKAGSLTKLRDVVNAFNDCSPTGTIDSSHPWCHLIDPDWVLKIPPTQCRAMAYGAVPVSSEIPSRTEQCVDTQTCLKQDDNGTCVGGWGYCARERNVWRFNGDSCPAAYNTCRTLKSRTGDIRNYLLNTIDHGVCNADNAGCRQYGLALSTVSCSLGSQCTHPTDANDPIKACPCTVSLASCNIQRNQTSCTAPNGTVCRQPYPCSSASCSCTTSLTCDVQKGQRSCSSLTGGASTGDDWQLEPSRFFNKNAQTCSASDNGCSGLVKLEAGQSLNLVKNGSFEQSEDGDNDGSPDHSTYWTPFADQPSGTAGYVRKDGSRSSDGANAVLLPTTVSTAVCTVPAGPNVDSNGNCSADLGCPCTNTAAGALQNYTCKVIKGHKKCTVTNAVSQDGLPVAKRTTYTLSATFVPDSGNAVHSKMVLSFRDANGTDVNLSSTDTVSTIDVTGGTASTQSCAVSGGDLVFTVDGTKDDLSKGLTTACTFVIDISDPSHEVKHAALSVSSTSGTLFADGIQLEEGGGSSYHEGYGAADTSPVDLKVPPAFLGCTGDEGDRPECASFAGVCRENEVGCDGYMPDNGDPTIPGIAGPQDQCPKECAGYDVFKQEESDFDTVKFPVYFIPDTAAQCTENDAGCSQFTSVETEKIEYYSRLRLCVKPDDPSVGTYYSWEGSDTTGYQLRVWSLKNTTAGSAVTPVAGGTSSDVCADPACVNAGPAPCTSLDANAENCDSKTLANPAGDTAGLCSRAQIDGGNFDCREFYDAAGNRHYRLLSKTIVASGTCTQYRITTSTQADCNKSNGRWDSGKGQCIYFADASQSRVCSAAQNNCRAYKGNASTNIRSLFIDDFESGISGWNDSTDAGIANLQQSGESVTVGGHSLKIGGTGPGRDARREIGGLVAPGRSYTLTFWARGTGIVNAGFRDGSIDLVCTNPDTCTSADGCGCNVATGLGCLVANGASSCTIPKVGKCLGGTNAGVACVSGATCTGGGTCSVPTPTPAKPRSLEFSDDDESAAAPRTSAPRIALSSEWKQFSLGPIIVDAPTDPTLTPWGRVSVKLQLETTGVCVGGTSAGASCTATSGSCPVCAQSDVFIDNVNLKEVQDSIFVVRDSWVTPASCDTTRDGVPSPQEMLGCKKYLKSSDRTDAYLKSFTNICREKAIGCAAFSDTQNTDKNPYEESFNAVCRLYAADGSPRKCGFQACTLGTTCHTPGGCTCSVAGSSCLVPNNGGSCDAPVPADAGAACVCDYDMRNPAASTSAPQLLSDVCRVAIGETDCRFKLDRWDDSTRADEHPDRVNVPADKRVYLVSSATAQCTAEAVGCRAMGQPHMSFEDTCNLPPTGTDITNGTCTATDGCTCGPINGATCKVTQGEKSCKVSFELGVVDKWNALALKDDPSKYEQTLCSTKTLNCEEYTASDGTFYFRNPDDKVCEYKVDANVNGQKVSGFFRRSSTGSLFPCYPELLQQGDFYAMYKNADPKCTLPNVTTSAPYTSTSPHIEQGRCKDPGGCLCFIAPNPIAVCRVYYGNTTCGYQGWVGQCEAKYDRCEEFIDPVATSASHPAGEPYYYIVNNKLDLKSCAGKASLKSGCVLFKQTSKTQNLYSSAATYFRSVYEAQSGIVPPVNCDVNPRSAYCEQRCFSIPEGVCDQTPDKFCKNDTEDPDLGCPGADNHCTGRKRWGNGCSVANGDKDCNQALGERCASTAHCSVTTNQLCDVNGDCPGGETCVIPSGLHLGKADAATVTANDANLIIKVRPDRECAQWFTCSSFNTVYDAQQNKVRPICSAFTLCDQTRNETATPYECTHVVEPEKKVFTDVDYSKRDTTFAGLEYSGYSIPSRYPAQYLSPYSIVQGLCVDHSGVDKLPVKFCTDSKTCTDAGAADDYCKKLSGVCVGDHLGQSCDAHDSNVGCGSGYCASSYFATTRFGILLDQGYACKTDDDCDGNDEDGSNCNPAHGDADCRSATNRVGKCVAFPDGAHKCSPTGQIDDGACIEHKCYYGYGGGKADPHDNVNDAQCRAYPELDSPYGESVVDNQAGLDNRGYDAMTYQAVAKKTDFKGTNVCSFNNDCECSYQRYQYGKGASIVRFYGYNGGAFNEDWAGGTVKPMPELNVGVCSGGSRDGYTCRPTASPNDCMVSSDDSGTCQKLSTVSILNGWTGFCMDPDKSILINGDQNQYNCNVWLPVDQLAGAPDNFNQFVEAGYNPAASSLLYCANAGGATSNFDTQIWAESGNFHPASPCQSKLGSGCAGMNQSQCNAARNNVSTPFSDMSLPNTPACHWTGSSCVDNIQFQDGATYTDPNPSNNPFQGTIYDFFWGFVVNPDGPKYYSACELAAFHASVTSCTLSTLAGIVIAGVTMGAAAAGSGPAACLYVLGFWCNQTTTCTANGGIATGNTHLFDTSWQDATATNHPIGGNIYENQLIGLRIEFPSESEAGGAVKGRMYLYPGRWQASFMFDDNDSLGTAAGPGGGDRVNGKAIGDYSGSNPCVDILNHGVGWGGAEGRCEDIEDDGLNNCIGAQAVFDPTSHKLSGIMTVLCHNESTFSHYIPANVFAMYRQSCYDVVQTHDASRLVPNIAWTDRLWKASPAGGNGGGGAMTFSGTAATFEYTHHTDRPGPSGYPADLTPFGPVNLVGPTTFGGTSTLDARWPIPVYSSEGGSPYTNIRREGPDLWTRCGTPDPNGMNTVNCPNGYQHVGSDPGINSGNDFPSPDAYGNSKPTAAGYPYAFGNAQAGMDQLSKMFVKSYAYWKFDPTTNVSLTPPVYVGQGLNYGYDRRTTYMNDNNAPRIVGLNTGDCSSGNDGLCRELPYPGCGPSGCGSLTVEFPEPDGAHIDGNLPSTPPTGRLTVKLKYYAYADKDHMALRRHIVDFGDGTPVVDTPGYFKNHRGCDNSTVGNCDDAHSICGHGTDWGVQPQACEPRYFQDTHTYTCNPQLIENLPECDSTGHPYPCKSGDTCEFKPRVQFLDNWGMCNGYCPGGDGSGNFCFNGQGGDGDDVLNLAGFSYPGDIGNPTKVSTTFPRNECQDLTNRNYQIEDAASHSLIPWTAFGGTIRVKS